MNDVLISSKKQNIKKKEKKSQLDLILEGESIPKPDVAPFVENSSGNNKPDSDLFMFMPGCGLCFFHFPGLGGGFLNVVLPLRDN